jgi:hypothetical protein
MIGIKAREWIREGNQWQRRTQSGWLDPENERSGFWRRAFGEPSAAASLMPCVNASTIWAKYMIHIARPKSQNERRKCQPIF